MVHSFDPGHAAIPPDPKTPITDALMKKHPVIPGEFVGDDGSRGEVDMDDFKMLVAELVGEVDTYTQMLSIKAVTSHWITVTGVFAWIVVTNAIPFQTDGDKLIFPKSNGDDFPKSIRTVDMALLTKFIASYKGEKYTPYVLRGIYNFNIIDKAIADGVDPELMAVV